VVDLINQVDAHSLPEQEWEPAQVDMPVYRGGEVWAQEASTARVEVAQGLVRVAPNTIFTFDQPDPDTMEVGLDEGQLWLDVDGLGAGERFEVETPAAVASVRGTRFSVRAEADGRTVVSTWASTVTVAAAGEVVTVTSGLEAVVAPGDPPGEARPMSPDEQIRWGMASGADLDVLLPAVGAFDVFSYTGQAFSHDWSPDGAMFVFTFFDVATGEFGHYLYDVAAGEVFKLAVPSTAGGIFFDPAGDGLAYQNTVSGGTEICTGGLDGVTGTCFGGDATYGWPLWSPDGEWIVFYSNRGLENGGMNLFRARRDGSELTQLTFDEAGYNIRQSWSPDGEWLAFVKASEYGGVGDLWLMRPDGSGARMAFEGVYANGYDHVAWHPDGGAVAVPAADGGLYTVPLDGSAPQVVTGTASLDCWLPSWSPTADGWPLFFGGWDAAADRPVVWATSRQGDGLHDIAGGEYFVRKLLWAPDGRHLAVAFEDRSGDVPQVFFHFFKTEPDFWR
jgi:hypothetical protein